MNIKKLNIAVIGGGVAGLTAAHILQRNHHVTLFEKNHYIGGHTNTILIEDGPDEGTPVDTGFIVLNDRTYPTFHKLLQQLRVPWRNSDMSFGFHCESSGLQYSGRGLTGIFAQPQSCLSPTYWRMLNDVRRFNINAGDDLQKEKTLDCSLGKYLQRYPFSNRFRDDYLLPMGSAIWSTPANEMLDFPAETFLRFFDNHGLLSVNNRPQWQTVVGGSHAYVKSFLASFNGTVELNSQIAQITRNANSITIHCNNRESQVFDRVVIAVHADQVLSLLADATNEEQAVYSKWTYTNNHTVLHTDDSVMPPNKRAWASWNYTREYRNGESYPLSLTYHMNRLQGLNTTNQYYVTLNRKQNINPSHVIREFHYTHPLFTHDAVSTQSSLKQMNGKMNTLYCGSYFGYGFHEDAVKSGVEVANALGMDL